MEDLVDKAKQYEKIYYVVPKESYEKTRRLFYGYFKINKLSSKYLDRIRLRKKQ